MTVPTPADDYFLEIESHFAARRGTPFILSAKDWALMKKWREDDVPLAVVIEAIDQVFEKNEASGRRKVISSLSYCRHAVKELWQDRKDLYAGSGDAPPEEKPFALLETLASDVANASGPQEILVEFAARIRDLIAEKSVPAIEERLIELEHELVQRLLASAEDGDAIRREVSSTVAGIEEKVRVRTEEANLRRLVRERYALPRLTLFR